MASVKLSWRNTQKSSFARPSPRNSPTTDASAPIANASTRTVRRICRRVAPIVLSVANSRARCATVIESELAITNAPTKSAIPPNESRNFCRKLVKLFVSLASSCAWPAPVRTWVAVGSTDRI